MGVRNLWALLSEVCTTDIDISSLHGKTLAVDLSSWICELKTIQASQQIRNLYLRNLFYRTSHLLKNGVKLVFVEDGRAPIVKASTLMKRQSSLDRMGLKSLSDKCCGLLKNLGLPCVQSKGEGEALCAYLNHSGKVDGVLTSDADALLYGACKLYRKLDIHGSKVECCDMEEVKEKLELDRRGLVTMALLCGGDYSNDGVYDIGIKKAHDFIKMCVKKDHDPLDRIKNWRTNPDLLKLQNTKDCLPKKESHCSVCKHLGKKKIHFTDGCITCKTNQSCDQVSKELCSCQHCCVEQNQFELKMREKALNDKGFPNQEIIDEYLNFGNADIASSLEWKNVNISGLKMFSDQYFIFKDDKDFHNKVAELLVTLHMNEMDWAFSEKPQPKRIIKKRKTSIRSVLVEWLIDGSHYEVSVSEEKFTKLYPEMMEQYEEEEDKKPKKKQNRDKRKLKTEDYKQGTLSDFFSVKKKARLSPERKMSAAANNDDAIVIE